MIEQHVTSLETSKRLKELGVEQKSMFMWDYDGELRVGIIQAISPHIKTAYPDEIEIIKVEDCYSAFLASELGEIFQDHFNPFGMDVEFGYNCCYHYGIAEASEDLQDEWKKEVEEHAVRWQVEDENEANMRGKMLIYLLEQGIIRV